MIYRAVDAMGFAGGFTLGMTQAGFELVGKRELPGGFGAANCEANRHLLGDNWYTEAVDPTKWSVPPGGVDVVFGNPPCSGFSVMSAKSFRGADSKINHCMWSFADYVVRARPTIAVFESVQQARNRQDGLELMRRLRARVEEGTGQSWTLHHVRHNAYSVGGCAQRRRYFWLISRVPFGIEPPEPVDHPSFEQVIGDLETLGRTWSRQPYRSPAHHPWVEQLRSSSGAVDGHVYLDNPMTRRMGDLLRGTEWRPGESLGVVCRRYHETHGRLPESFTHLEERFIEKDFSLGFTTPTRWNGLNASRVITGGSLQLVIHPHLDRTVTHREAARVLGFPDDWRIEPLRGVPGLHMTWGKGISVHCGRWIGSWIRRALDGHPGSDPGKPLGEREYDIDVTNTWRTWSSRPSSHGTVAQHVVG